MQSTGKGVYTMLINAGYQNFIPIHKILAITGVTSNPLVRQRQLAEKEGRLIDCTMGRSMLSLIHLPDGYIAVSAITPKKLQKRISEIMGVSKCEVDGRTVSGICEEK